MRISHISGINNNIGFKRVYTTGRDAMKYEFMIRPYHKELEKISKGYNVEIKTGKSLYVSDDYNEEQIPIYPTTVSINPEVNSAYYVVPKVKLYVNPAANPCIGDEYEVKDIINTIQKGIGILKK